MTDPTVGFFLVVALLGTLCLVSAAVAVVGLGCMEVWRYIKRRPR